MKIIAVFLLLLATVSASAGEREDLEAQLREIQREQDVERYRYNAAKAEMERSEIVARYYFPRLQQREAEIKKKLEEIDRKKN